MCVSISSFWVCSHLPAAVCFNPVRTGRHGLCFGLREAQVTGRGLSLTLPAISVVKLGMTGLLEAWERKAALH